MAMSSLTPGVLFKNPGLNQNRTPTGITASSEQVKQKYRRSSIPDKTWPPESPVARVYDIRNTSSGLIILNNKMEKKSHLRVQSGRYKSSSAETSGDEKNRAIEPERHFYSSMSKASRHEACHDSSTPKFESRPYTAESPQRSSHRYTEGLGGPARPSEWHHYSSQIDRYRAYSAPVTQRNKSAGRKTKTIEPPPCFSRDKNWLQHPDMTHGQKKYMNSIACTYDITDMKQLKQAQYIQLIYREQQRGFFTPENYRKYLIYLNGDRVRGFNVQAPPKTLTRTTSNRKKKSRDRSEDGNRLSQRDPKQEKPEAALDSPKSEQTQSAPRPPNKRVSKSLPVANGSHEKKTPTEQNSTVKGDTSSTARGDVDSTQYMMYSEPENPKQRKTSKPHESSQHADGDDRESPRRGSRPKSSKFRSRPDGEDDKPTLSQESEGGSKSHKHGDKNRLDKSKDETTYWQQPAPPAQQTEPDGNGLTMTKGTNLEKGGESLEAVASIYDEDNETPQAKPSSQRPLANNGEEGQIKAYDILEEDGTKRRVYESHEGSRKARLFETPTTQEDEFQPGVKS